MQIAKLTKREKKRKRKKKKKKESLVNKWMNERLNLECQRVLSFKKTNCFIFHFSNLSVLASKDVRSVEIHEILLLLSWNYVVWRLSQNDFSRPRLTDFSLLQSPQQYPYLLHGRVSGFKTSCNKSGLFVIPTISTIKFQCNC